MPCDNSEWIFGTYKLNVLTWLELLLLRLIFYLCSYSDFLFLNQLWLWLTESEQATPVDSIKDVVRSSVKVPEFDKHLKKAGGHIGQNVLEITWVQIPDVAITLAWLHLLSLQFWENSRADWVL